jgi:hypothetical protein
VAAATAASWLFVTIHHDRGSRTPTPANHRTRIDLRKQPQGLELLLPYLIKGASWFPMAISPLMVHASAKTTRSPKTQSTMLSARTAPTWATIMTEPGALLPTVGASTIPAS